MYIVFSSPDLCTPPQEVKRWDISRIRKKNFFLKQVLTILELC